MRISLTLLILIALLFSSCEREFDNNPDFTQDSKTEVFGDNQLLFTKIFQLSGSNAYLWFDIRNEIANFSKPTIGLNYTQDEIARYKQIDLRGRLYSYDGTSEELTVMDYPLDMATGTDIPADLVFGFSRKQKEGCEAISDPGQRRQCERTFVLKIKRIAFKTIDFTLEKGVKGTYNNRSLVIESGDQEALLTN